MEPLNDNLVCLKCGYDLRGTPGDRCSECGTPFGKVDDRVSRIPWERDVHGIFRYPLTIFAMAFQGDLINDEPLRDHDPKRARGFGFFTFLLTAFPMVILYSITHFFELLSPADIFNKITQGYMLNYWSSYRDLTLNAGSYYFHDFFLLMSIALYGTPGLLAGCFVFTMAVFDALRAPGAVLSAGMTRDERLNHKNTLKPLGHYLSGIVAVLILLLLILSALNVYLIRSGNISPIDREDFLGIRTFLTATLLIPGLLHLALIGAVVNRVHQYRKRLVGKVNLFGTLARLLGMWLWRLFFWLVCVPCFIGLIRLVLSSLSWTV